MNHSLIIKNRANTKGKRHDSSFEKLSLTEKPTQSFEQSHTEEEAHFSGLSNRQHKVKGMLFKYYSYGTKNIRITKPV